MSPADFDRVALVTRKRPFRRGEFVFLVHHGRVFVQLGGRVDKDSWAVKAVADTSDSAASALSHMVASYLADGYDHEEFTLEQVPPLTAEMLDPDSD